jgi:hypothetical protein
MLIHHNYNFIIILVITTIILYYIYTLLNKEHFVVSPPPTPTPIAFYIVLNTGECMDNRFVTSPNGKYKAWQQSDGHLVVYNTVTNKPIWYTGSYLQPNGKLCMQTDGNLVNYTSNNVGFWYNGKLLNHSLNNVVYWATSTTGNNNQLIIKDDGDLVIRDSVNGNVKWSSTNGLVTQSTETPTPSPTVKATIAPTTSPTVKATVSPTTTPTVKATVSPTTTPTVKATVSPTTPPTVKATVSPTPTVKATVTPAPATPAPTTPAPTTPAPTTPAPTTPAPTIDIPLVQFNSSVTGDKLDFLAGFKNNLTPELIDFMNNLDISNIDTYFNGSIHEDNATNLVKKYTSMINKVKEEGQNYVKKINKQSQVINDSYNELQNVLADTKQITESFNDFQIFKDTYVS